MSNLICQAWVDYQQWIAGVFEISPVQLNFSMQTYPSWLSRWIADWVFYFVRLNIGECRAKTLKKLSFLQKI
jgi:hypothetical protein